MGYDAGSRFGDNLFICTNFSDGCDGDITIGSPETCEITNVLVFCEQEVRTLSNTENTPFGFNSPAGVAYDDENNIMYVANQGGVLYLQLIPIQTHQDETGSPITVGNNPFGIAV